MNLDGEEQMKIVFVHGWGGDTFYWDELISEMKKLEMEGVDAGALQSQYARLDLGFTDQATRIDPPFEKALYVTHSLGTMWALKQHKEHMSALVAINGFTCFHEFTDRRVLNAMGLKLKRNAMKQMVEFAHMANMQPAEHYNEECLAQGLSWLQSWDARESLQNLSVPAIAIAGSQDQIVPLKALEAQFGGAFVKQDGGHNLAQTHAGWCANIIASFIKTLE